LNEVLKLDKRYLEALISRGNLYIALRKWQEAKQDFETILTLAPKTGAAYLGLAECETNLSHPEAAIAAYNAALLEDTAVSCHGVYALRRA
jgi:tetratricopeptide (TPR) repeat protein